MGSCFRLHFLCPFHYTSAWIVLGDFAGAMGSSKSSSGLHGLGKTATILNAKGEKNLHVIKVLGIVEWFEDAW